MNKPNKEQMYGIAGTVTLHAIVLIILLLVVIELPSQQPESGVPVIMGNVDASSGEEYTYTEVQMSSNPTAVNTSTPNPVLSADESLITQTDEATVAIESSDKKKNDNSKPRETAEELKAREEERKRQEAEKIARMANDKIASAFGRGASMTADNGDSQEGKGREGSPDGNDTSGVVKGSGGYGTFDLSGRSLGEGGLPRPIHNMQDEGRVVVTITVNPDGDVVSVSINSRTDTANPKMRQAALNAAKKARFNSVKTLNNQQGTITYYFKLK